MSTSIFVGKVTPPGDNAEPQLVLLDGPPAKGQDETDEVYTARLNATRLLVHVPGSVVPISTAQQFVNFLLTQSSVLAGSPANVFVELRIG
jgi:hypothetical protein